MITVQLFGGLGNQMFQYALGRHLSIKNNSPLQLDLTRLNLHKPIKNAIQREYSLDIFKMNATLGEPSEMKKFHHEWKLTGVLRHAGQRLTGLYVKEDLGQFNAHVLDIHRDVYLDGYWQSEAYFKNIADTIGQDFTFRTEIARTSRDLLNQLTSGESICLHVRRSDYVTNPVVNKFLGTCGLDYYERAVNLIAEKVEQPFFYIFSDDSEWCRANIHIKNHPFRIIGPEHDGDKYENKFKLMTECKHYIIANSSFSWWAAWLSRNPQKVIVAPQRWFNDPKYNNINNIIPRGWITT